MHPVGKLTSRQRILRATQQELLESGILGLRMEVVAENVEEPFGLDEDDLDLEGMCKTIEQSLDEVFAPS